MKFHIITLFPKAFDSYLKESILRRAIDDDKVSVRFYNPRDYTTDSWRRIDRAPYAGGPGMVIQAEPVIGAIEHALKMCTVKRVARNEKKRKTRHTTLNAPLIIWLSPQGKQFTNILAKSYASKYTDVVIICGRYEGIDARVKKVFKTADVSVGPFVLTGGELPAEIIIDAVSRQIEGVLGDKNSLEENRVASPDVYTRPESFKYKGKTYRVPKVLLSGNHKKIEEWKAGRRR